MSEPFRDVPLAAWGGRNTLIPRDALPPFMSPAESDCAFVPGEVLQRPGLTRVFDALSGNPKVNALYDAGKLDGTRFALVLTNAGALMQEASGSTLLPVGATAGRLGLDLRGGMLNAFDRHYGTLSGQIRSDFFGVITTTPPGRYGTVPAFTFHRGGTSYVFRCGITRPAINPTAATNATAGTSTAGTHDVRLVFQAIDGTQSAPSQPFSFTAVASKQYVVQRNGNFHYPAFEEGALLVYMTTVAAPATWFFTGASITPGATSVTFDISDALLALNEPLDVFYFNRFFHFAPPPQLGVFGGTKGPFNNRIAVLGGLHEYGQGNNDADLTNLYFDWGTPGAGPSTTVLPGWNIPAGVSYVQGVDGATNEGVLRFTGDGITSSFTAANLGDVVSHIGGAAQLGIPGGVGVRIRARKSAGLVSGDIVIEFAGTGAGVTATIANAFLSTEFQVYEVYFTNCFPPGAVSLWVSVNGTASNGQTVEVDYAVPFNGEASRTSSTIYFTNPGTTREFNSVTGVVNVSEGDGEDLRAAFELAGRWFEAKQRAVYAQIDNGGDPSSWSAPEKIADGIGVESFDGVGRGEEWVVLAGRAGLFYFQGGGLTDQNNLSGEIQPDWDAINWLYGHLIKVVVDIEDQRIYVAVPVGSATECSHLYVLDFKEGFGDATANGGVGRHWSIWQIPSNSIALVERPSTGKRVLMLGNQVGNGKIYKLDPTVYDDDGAPIVSYYETGPFGAGGHQALVKRVTLNIRGATNVANQQAALTAWWSGVDGLPVFLGSVNLYDPGRGHPRIRTHLISEHVGIRVGSPATGTFWVLTNMTLEMKTAPYHRYRPLNP